MIPRLFRRPDPTIASLYGAIVAQARDPAFYDTYGVPDTALGRFELIALHAFLVMRRLKREGEAGTDAAQALFDLMFADVDRNLREMGVGDLGVGRRVKTLAKGFFGCVRAYEEALDGDPAGPALGAALARNLYAGAPPAPDLLGAVAGYVRRVDRARALQFVARSGQVARARESRRADRDRATAVGLSRRSYRAAAGRRSGRGDAVDR